MKKRIINILIVTIVIITSVTGIKAATTILASSVTYGDKTVEDALDELIEQANTIDTCMDEETAKNNLYNSLQYSGLVTEDMSLQEMYESLSKNYPAYFNLLGDTTDIYSAIAGSSIVKTALSITDSAFVLTIRSYSSGAEQNTRTFRRTEKIDLTNYNKFVIQGTATYIAHSCSDCYGTWVGKVQLVSAGGDVIDVHSGYGSIDKEYDISELTGDYYLQFYGNFYQDAGVTYNFNEFRFEV